VSISRRELLFASTALAFGLSRCRPRVAKPDIVLVTLDTTRRDRLGFYGYSRKTSPNLDVLAAGSHVFDRAVAASSWTLPSHASIFTGKFPSSHGADYDPKGPLRLSEAVEGPPEWAEYRASGLRLGESTLALRLRDQGYQTAAVVGGPWMKRIFGLDRGFERYDDEAISDVNGRLASEVTASALEILEQRDGRPLFLFLNYFDPHGPYEAPSPFGGSFGEEPADRYDEEILYMDHHFGRLLEGMRRQGIFEGSFILVTADHGELLGEHGRMGHGATLFEEEIHVPFLAKYPDGEITPGRSRGPVHHVDVLPMILERLGIARESGPRPLLAEVSPLPFVSPEGSWRALYLGRHKLLWNGLGNHRLYDLEADPQEENDLSTTDRPRTEEAIRLLDRVVSSLPPPGKPGSPASLDEETLKALRSLGYVP
jgi:arylsulfatase A-like enzyme